MTPDQKQTEETKREQCWSAQQRWAVLQQTIAWVDQQQPISRNSPRACIEKQTRLLAAVGANDRSRVNRLDDLCPPPGA